MYDEFKSAVCVASAAEAHGDGGVVRAKSGRGFYDYADPEKPRANSL